MASLTSNYYAIIPAAGLGNRMNSKIPKQYLRVHGKTILEYSLAILRAYPIFKQIIVVLNEQDHHWHSLGIKDAKLVTTSGGYERYHSVFNGLLALKQQARDDDWVLVHDAVRPCLQLSDLDKLVSLLAGHPVGGLLGAPVQDTIKQVDAQQGAVTTLTRPALWQAFTPQMFRYQLLYQSLKEVIAKQISVTDEAHAVELTGAISKLVLGRRDNIKVTEASDLTYIHYYYATQASSLLGD